MRLAARGQRDMDSGVEQVADHDILRALRAQARRVQTRAVATALVLTVVFTLIT